MRESNQPIQMSGEEIARTFGSRDVLELEQICEILQSQINTVREQFSEHLEDEEVQAKEQEQIDELSQKLKQLRIELREKRNKYGKTLSETTHLS